MTAIERMRQLAFAAAVAAAMPGVSVAATGRSAALDAALATISADELRDHTGFLANDTLEGREAGSRGGRAAARYLEERLKAMGLRPGGTNGYVQRFSPNYQNLLAVLPGADAQLASEHILVGAHYDHVGYGNRRNSNGPIGYIHNGADDNASGVAALLEVMDALTRTSYQPRRSILFALWDGEEVNLLGSRHWVRQPTVPLKQVPLSINIDMVGRMTRNRLEVGGTRTGFGLRRLFSSPSLPEELVLDFTWEFKENSDHWPLNEAGVPAMILHTGVHGDYHRPSDDIEKLNIDGMRSATAYLLEMLCRVADADELPKHRPAGKSEYPSMRVDRERPLAPLPTRLGLSWEWKEIEGEPRIRVTSVKVGSAAERAGIRTGDVVTTIDGVAVQSQDELPAAVLRAESTLELTILRDDSEPQSVSVVLDGAPVGLGLSWREDAAAPSSVFITRVVPHSPAARAGLAVQDRIHAIDGEPFENGTALLGSVKSRLTEASAIQFEIETAGRIRTVDVQLLPGRAATEDPSL